MESLQKTKRIIDLDLLRYIKTLPCLACGVIPCDPHHVKTRGAGGDDTARNVMPLCTRHHVEIHTIGKLTMSERYPVVAYWLDAAKELD